MHPSLLENHIYHELFKTEIAPHRRLEYLNAI